MVDRKESTAVGKGMNCREEDRFEDTLVVADNLGTVAVDGAECCNQVEWGIPKEVGEVAQVAVGQVEVVDAAILAVNLAAVVGLDAVLAGVVCQPEDGDQVEAVDSAILVSGLDVEVVSVVV